MTDPSLVPHRCTLVHTASASPAVRDSLQASGQSVRSAGRQSIRNRCEGEYVLSQPVQCVARDDNHLRISIAYFAGCHRYVALP